MKYVYQTIPTYIMDAKYFSSWRKAFKYCNDMGCTCRDYEDEYRTIMTNGDGQYIEIRKHRVDP